MLKDELDTIASQASFTTHFLSQRGMIPELQQFHRGIIDPLSTEPHCFWVDKIDWTYQYFDVGHPKARIITPLKPIEISVSSVLAQPIFKGTSSKQYNPRQSLTGAIYYEIENTNLANHHQLEVKLSLTGLLVTAKPGCVLPSAPEQLLFIQHCISPLPTNTPQTNVCQCSLRTIMATGCQCGGN